MVRLLHHKARLDTIHQYRRQLKNLFAKAAINANASYRRKNIKGNLEKIHKIKQRQASHEGRRKNRIV